MEITVQRNKVICREFFNELHNKKNYAIIDRYVDEDVVSHDPFPGQVPGAQGLKDTIRLFHRAFPDLQVEIEDMIAEEDKVATRLLVKGTHKGEFMSMAASDNKIEYKEMIVLWVTNGKITEHWAIADSLALMQQVGIIPEQAPGEQATG